MVKQICIAATFTAESVEDSIEYWMELHQMDARVRFAPYGQVIESILDPQGLLAANQNGINVVLLRPIDLLKQCPYSVEQDRQQAKRWIEVQINRLIAALSAPQKSTYFIYIGFPFTQTSAELVDLTHSIEQLLHQASQTLFNTHLFSLAELKKRYGVSSVLDVYSEQIAHIPYTPEYFAAIGTQIARNLNTILARPYKVIALDCDNTLYDGVCAEDGALGVRISQPFQALQQFMIDRYEQGFLLCLCSKNIESDVMEVFDRHPQMLLKREHVAACRINWESKADNLRSLAEELQLGLDSFVFIDDNPVECALVQLECPQVLTLHLPENPDQIPLLLDQCWAFDRITITNEDQMRTKLYRSNRQRQTFQEQISSEEEFLAQLELSVAIKRLQIDQVERAAQLTQRTNQFNFANRRYSAQEIQQHNKATALDWWTVTVADKFGTYGLVGLMATSSELGVLNVNTFLLSCRVLNKRVEHAMVATLVDIARNEDCTDLHFLFTSTPRNVPARKFLMHLGGAGSEGEQGVRCGVDLLASTTANAVSHIAVSTKL